jgi:polyribonucleotide nucleotidyltransferase
MATVCGSSLALMDAGVPIKAAVAGIAMGLIKLDDNVVILTDILGDEDHFGDMDFKVTGTAEGVTAIQMDIKITGLDIAIMKTALDRARDARLYILEKMNAALPTHRDQLSQYAPRIITIKINPSKIGEVIGPGGKMIRSIVEETGAKIDISDDGTVLISSVDAQAGLAAKARVEAIVEEPEVGRVYKGIVRRITQYGAIVEMGPNMDGWLHISELEHHRVGRVEDVCRLGDEFDVKVLNIEPDGKVRLSRKALLPREGGGDNGGQDKREERSRR